MTYNIYYDDREIHSVDVIIDIVSSEITDVIDNYYNICLEQSIKIKETIKEIEAYQSDNVNYLENLNLAYKIQYKNNESLKKLKELMNQLKELKIYIY
jgi:hypothetical protein